MGREVRRIALDFSWPLHEPYGGFLRPDHLEPLTCETCGGNGLSPEGKEMYDRWWGYIPFRPEETGSSPFTAQDPGILDYARRKIMDSRAFYDQYLGSRGEDTVHREAERLCQLWNQSWRHHLSQDNVDDLLRSGRELAGLTHIFDPNERRWIRIDCPTPSQREVNLWGLDLDGGLVQVPQGVIEQGEARRRGITTECVDCDGMGQRFQDEAHQQAHDEWEGTPPPPGEGWQIWETVGEGSPVSPVFGTPEALAHHMAEEDVDKDDGMAYQGWLSFISGTGWAPTCIEKDGLLVPGHQMVSAKG